MQFIFLGQAKRHLKIRYHLLVTARDVIRKLQDAGWTQLRHSKHLIVTKDGKICPIPIHGSADIKIGTLVSIERITGVKLR